MSRKIGVNLSIDVKAIDKARLVAHQNGKTYLNMTVFIDPDSPDNYGQHGMITQDVSKQEKDSGIKGNILGNAKVFWQDNSQPQQTYQAPPAPQQAPQAETWSDDVPF